jgi:hypothetical protein
MSKMGHSLQTHLAPVPINVRYAPKATKSPTCCELRFVPVTDIRYFQFRPKQEPWRTAT